MTRRTGMTLVEVLVAIFIMAIGLLALLTLFPIGILRIAQALGDERKVQCGTNAAANFISQGVGNDPALVIPGGADYFSNPLVGTLPNADPYGESYAVLMDPIGFNGAPAGSAQDWVAGVPGYLRRRPAQFTGGVMTNVYKSFTLWDDMSFNGVLDPSLPPQGTPQMSGPTVLRDTRYSWAYLLRRPQTSDLSIVDCSVVVFDQRSLAPTPGALTLEEYAYPSKTYFSPSANTITIDYTSNVPPPVRAGDWIMDGTLTTSGAYGSAHAYFYRVVATEEFVVAGKTLARYEVQNPVRGFAATAPTAANPVNGQTEYIGTAIIIRGIAEVFEKGPMRLP